MLGTRIALLTIGILTAGLFSAPPAGASGDWEFDTRPEGFPVSETSPAQTLASASGTWSADEDEGFTATVVLGAEPTSTTSATLEVAVGAMGVMGGCEAWSVRVQTWRPTGPAHQVGSTVTVHVPGASVPANLVLCGSVSVISADGVLLDRLEDRDAGLVGADEGTGGMARIARVDGVVVPPKRWTRMFVLVTYRGSDASGVRLRAESRTAQVRGTVVRDKLESGDERWLSVRVRLPEAKTARVQLTPQAIVPMGRSGEPVWVTLRPRR